MDRPQIDALRRAMLTRCIAALETAPPTNKYRDDAIRALKERLQDFPASNVIPLFGRR